MADALPSPPFVDIPGIYNFRDIGTEAIRSGLLFRSADPNKVSEEGLKKLSHELGLKVIFDLRSEQEIARDGPEWAGVEVDASEPFAAVGIKREWVPVFATKDYGPEEVAIRYKNYTTGTSGFVKAYFDIMNAAPKAYGAIFRYLAQPSPSPCLVHCTAGKDRTGVLVALLFLLMGVDKESIGEEYALTDQGLAPLKPFFLERLMKNPALQYNRDGLLNMMSSKKETMDATLEMIVKEFEGPEAYMKKQCGMSVEEIQQLKKNLGRTCGQSCL